MQRNAQRRRHKKSRGGCSQCKRRHVKCDEGRPSCSNCTVSELRCVYAADLSAGSDNGPSLTIPENENTSRYRSTRSTPALQTPVQTPSQPGELVPDAQTGHPSESDDLFAVNIEHLKLFNHVMEHDLVYTKHSDATDQGILTKSMIRYALSTPYLAHQVLSAAALHLSLSDSGQREHYRQLAQGLQTRALSLFNSVQPVVNAETCIPMLMFSSFVGLHVLCDTVNFGVTDPDKFLDGFARYINLHRGVRAVTNQSWHYLRSTDLAPVVEAAEMNARAADLQGEECADLRALVAFSDTGQSAKQAYSDAIDRLQAIFDAERRQGPSEFVFSWPVLISPEYTELIMQRRPEALLILSYYAVLLHRQRSYWLVGRAGKLLLAAINAHLGTYWQPYLAWPAAAIAGDP